MKILEQSVQIIAATPYAETLIASAARTCYQSLPKVAGLPEQERQNADADLIRRLIKSGHHSVLEHASITVRIVTDRATTHELVRHRLASFSQESTRYCNYSGEGITVVWPVLFGPMPDNLDCLDVWSDSLRTTWREACLRAERLYMRMIADHAPAQLARKVLPQSLKAEIVVTANVREWRHILTLRGSRSADPQIRDIAIRLWREFQTLFPVLFDDIELIEGDHGSHIHSRGR